MQKRQLSRDWSFEDVSEIYPNAMQDRPACDATVRLILSLARTGGQIVRQSRQMTGTRPHLHTPARLYTAHGHGNAVVPMKLARAAGGHRRRACILRRQLAGMLQRWRSRADEPGGAGAGGLWAAEDADVFRPKRSIAGCHWI